MFGIFPQFMPSFNVNGKEVTVSMTEIVQFFMYLSAAINLLMLKVNTSDISLQILHNLLLVHYLQYSDLVG